MNEATTQRVRKCPMNGATIKMVSVVVCFIKQIFGIPLHPATLSRCHKHIPFLYCRGQPSLESVLAPGAPSISGGGQGLVGFKGRPMGLSSSTRLANPSGSGFVLHHQIMPFTYDASTAIGSSSFTPLFRVRFGAGRAQHIRRRTWLLRF